MSADEQREIQELEREFRRVGITWDAFGELCRLNAPNEPVSPDGSFAMELNYTKTAAFLRTLPDGAGQAGFIAAWLENEKPLRERAKAAMRAAQRRYRQRLLVQAILWSGAALLSLLVIGRVASAGWLYLSAVTLLTLTVWFWRPRLVALRRAQKLSEPGA
jgi:hypothetical protein